MNVKLQIEQQIHGLVGVIETQYGMLEVKIPGACDGDKYKIRSKGKNFIINVQELRHKNFTRQGFNVIMKLNVDAVQAMKGGTMPIDPCGNNIQNVKIKPGVKDDTYSPQQDLDFLNPRTKKRGDLHVYTVTKLPILDSEEKIRKFIERLENE